MGRKARLLALTVLLLLGAIFLLSCGEDPADTETEEPRQTETDALGETDDAEDGPHGHEFVLTETVAGTCSELGYRRYACSCGMSYKETIPAEHAYKTVVDVTGEYTKTVCSECGDYKIVRNQKYLYNIDFENVNSVSEAAEQPPNLAFYVIAGGGAELVTDDENTYMKIATSNYYVQDKSGIFHKDTTVVFSMDIKVEKYAAAELLSIVYKTGSKWAYTRGVVRLEADGTLGFYSAGNGKYNKTVTLSDKGYNTITLVGDLTTYRFDVYVNDELVREGVQYVAPPAANTEVYIRYFDQKKDYIAYADNLKLYEAATPEFIVPTSGIVFFE